MPTLNIYTGTSPSVAQVDTLGFGGTVVTGDTFSVTIGSRTITITVGATQTGAAACALMLAALQASAYGQFLEVTWASPTSTTITGTAKTPGYPFTISAFTTTGSGTHSLTHTTASSGPYHYNTAGNWSQGRVPQAGDTIIVQNPGVRILYGLDDYAAVSLDDFQIRTNTNGQFGLPQINNRNTAAPYPEYRPTYIKVLCGAGAPYINTGSNLCRINFLASAVAVDMQRSGSNGAEAGVMPIAIKGSAITTYSNHGALVDICPFAGETAAFTTVSHYSGTTRASDGLTFTGAVLCNGGILTIGGASTPSSITVQGGTCNVNGSIAPDGSGSGGLTVSGGTCNWNSTGGCTNASDSFVVVGKMIFSASGTRTFAPLCQVYAGATVTDSNGTVTLTNKWKTVECRLSDVTVDWGIGRTYANS